LSSLWIVLTVRCLLVLLFLPFSALDKILNHRQAVAQAEQAVSARALASALIFMGFGIELVMSLAILTGIADRLAALILAGYCMLTALLWKQFWRAPDFRLKGQSRGRDVFWDFLKNLALSGGFLLLALGSDASGVQRFRDHPLSSSHPYAPIAPIAPAGGSS
jgi:putative oxidoreductase